MLRMVASMALVLATTIATSAVAIDETFDTVGAVRANEAYSSGDYAKAFDLYKGLAEKGLAFAEYRLGSMYASGRGVSKNVEEAASWYRKSADRGLSAAAFYLGAMYSEGSGVPRDEAVGFKWYKEAARGGNGGGQFAVGNGYRLGKGTDKDAEQAMLWLRKAAEQKDIAFAREAQYIVATMYESGEGVAKDAASAARWYRRAALAGHTQAQDILGTLLFIGRGVAKDEGAAARWFREAAERGEAHSQYRLGALYANGQAVERDLLQGYYWLSLSARGLGPSDELVASARQYRDQVASQLTSTDLAQADMLVQQWRPKNVGRAVLPDESDLRFLQAAASDVNTENAAAATALGPISKKVICTKEAPRFPREAARARVSPGRVGAVFTVDERGAMVNVQIVASDPPGVFDQAVHDTLMTWRCGAEGARYKAFVEIDFRLP